MLRLDLVISTIYSFIAITSAITSPMCWNYCIFTLASAIYTLIERPLLCCLCDLCHYMISKEHSCFHSRSNLFQNTLQSEKSSTTVGKYLPYFCCTNLIVNLLGNDVYWTLKRHQISDKIFEIITKPNAVKIGGRRMGKIKICPFSI